ncbi:MAG TPA: type I pantothenate kinase [Aliidongia sp.]|nr:type I pantothenate kinase [Aliidongia sp.]
MTAPFRRFERREWAALRLTAAMPPTTESLAALSGINEPISPDEVAEIYLPLADMLNVRLTAVPRPAIVAVAGSVAVGKSCFARVLQTVLARGPHHPRVALIGTDGFLHPNLVLEARGLMQRKGFPETYDLPRLADFLSAAKSGAAKLEAPVYSHLTYDIAPDRRQVIERSDILILEGVNALQPAAGGFVDFSIYLDADERDIEAWFMERFKLLQQTAFQDPASYFYRYRDVAAEAALVFAAAAWREINLVNLREHIAPTRERADLVLMKRADHSVGEIRLRPISARS